MVKDLLARIKRPFVRAIFVVFVVLVGVLAAGIPSYAYWEGGGGEVGQNVDPHDVNAPPGMQYYIRQVPVVIYDPDAVKFDTEKTKYFLDHASLVWGELWSKDEWTTPDSRFGLNELYIPIEASTQLAPASGTQDVAIPIDWKQVNTAETKNLVTGLVTYHYQGITWGKDASPAVLMRMPLPSKDAFLAQGPGINEALAGKYASWFGSRITSSTGRQYYRALDAYQHGATYYYSLMLNPGPQSGNYSIPPNISPYYDENGPTGKGFYRGREWSTQLESKDPGSVPGLVGSITGWCNLKLTGPTEITGSPGEEKELTFEAVSEAPMDVTTQVGTKREGEQQYQKVVDNLKVPAWGKVPVTLKFKVEDQPYTVRVKVNPFETILETDYSDNYVDVTVKPVETPLPPGNGELVFYARSQGGYDLEGNYKPPEDRPVNTAKYADIVKAVLKPAPPKPPRGKLVSWEITEARLSYPKKHPDFSFGHPLEPVGTVTVNMKVQPGGHEAVVEFLEDWSVAGAPIYDMWTEQMAPPPTEYTITAEYTVHYVYKYYVLGKGWEYAERTETKSASGKLLVNSTGINIL
ncbi:hypothetical protein [Neomoorella humiferrea]|uniref:hypothetical protein n=1 Tax=Neomoorella humiferrea TaxID=676965 RepID=UPI0030CE24D5